MTAAAVISLRGPPMMAQEELTMFFYISSPPYCSSSPASLVSAELGGAFAAKGGGVYTWVKEAYNKKAGFLAIFLQWIQNVAWYPIVLGFAAAAIAYTIGKPELADNGKFVGIFSIAVYWLATLLTFKGSSIVSKITSRGFPHRHRPAGHRDNRDGTGMDNRRQPHRIQGASRIRAGNRLRDRRASPPAFLPPYDRPQRPPSSQASCFCSPASRYMPYTPTNSATRRSSTRSAMFIAAIMSFLIFTLGALAMAVITPYKDISLQSGLMESFRYVFDHYHIGWMTNVVSLLVAFERSPASSWDSGAERGLL